MAEIRQRKGGAAPAAPPTAAAGKEVAPPAGENKQWLSKRCENIFIGGLIATLLLPSAACYYVYGKHFFIPDEFTRLAHSPEEWQEMLSNRTVVFIGGPHRGGTSVLWEVLATHPAISAFGGTRETGSDHSEGAFVQSVYPRFGIGAEFQRGYEGGRGGSKWQPIGLGRFALAAEEKTHWTEEHHFVGPAKQAQLLNDFGRFWDLGDKPILLEKSPPNAVLSRFLQALVNVGNGAWTPEPPDFGGVPSRAKFIFISRHPLANAYAHRALGACKDERLQVLLSNWLAVHEWLEADEARLQSVYRLTLEDFAKRPQATIEAIWAWLGLEPMPELAAAAAQRIRPDPNKHYHAQHCEHTLSKPEMLEHYLNFTAEINKRVTALTRVGGKGGKPYDMLDDEWRCVGYVPEPAPEDK
jgi:hypothetical protein